MQIVVAALTSPMSSDDAFLSAAAEAHNMAGSMAEVDSVAAVQRVAELMHKLGGLEGIQAKKRALLQDGTYTRCTPVNCCLVAPPCAHTVHMLDKVTLQLISIPYLAYMYGT